MEVTANRRVCLLTGASGRLGTAFCRLFGARYHIAAVYRRQPPDVPSQLQAPVDPLRPRAAAAGGRGAVYAIRADLTVETERARVVDIALARFDRIDLVVHAAGEASWAPILDGGALLESAARQMELNALLPLRLTALVAQRCWRDRPGENATRSVVTVSSTAGLTVYPGRGQSVYGASKAALNHLTRHLASELRPLGVRVNAVAPNSFPEIVATDDVARAIQRLDAGKMNGKILVLDRDGERWA